MTHQSDGNMQMQLQRAQVQKSFLIENETENIACSQKYQKDS